MQSVKFVIIGGGVGGLSAANTLLDKGQIPLIIEAGHFPAFKVCGEFVSPEALPVLRKWGIVPSRLISQLQFKNAANKSFALDLKQPAGALSRTELEDALKSRAIGLGATLYEGVRVLKIDKVDACYQLNLSNNESILAEKILVSAGRFFTKNGKKPDTHYVGYKAHFTGAQLTGQNFQSLIMHMHTDGYYGYLPLEDGRINVTLLQKKGKDQLFEQMNEQLKSLSIWEPGWIKVEAPRFGLKKIPIEKNIYYLGDACAAIPPVTGLGVTLALLSGVVAGETCETLSASQYRKLWLKNFKWPIQMGLLVHRLAMSALSLPLFFLVNPLSQRLTHYFFTRTRVARLYFS